MYLSAHTNSRSLSGWQESTPPQQGMNNFAEETPLLDPELNVFESCRRRTDQGRGIVRTAICRVFKLQVCGKPQSTRFRLYPEGHAGALKHLLFDMFVRGLIISSAQMLADLHSSKIQIVQTAPTGIFPTPGAFVQDKYMAA